MHCQLFSSILALVGILSASSVHAEDPAPSGANTPTTVIQMNDVSYIFPFTVPSREEIVLKVPVDAGEMNPRIECELLAWRLNDPQYYPLLGPARLAEFRFKCTVSVGEKSQSVYMDRNRMIVEK